MDIDPLAPRYYLEIKATSRVDPKRYRYEIWERLDAPWLILTRGRYATEVEARDVGQADLRRFVDEANP